MRMKKVGEGYHTEFDHLYRGAAYGSSAGTVTVTTGTERSSVTSPAGGASPRTA
jgi:hypothetical protein